MIKRGVVGKQTIPKSDTASRFESAISVLDDYNDNNQFIESASQGSSNKAFDAVNMAVPSCIYLNLEDLKCFEPVERQYEQWGIIFHNCIAITPSNPAFPPHSGLVVLMGAPKSGVLEATFLRPVQFVSAFVTSSQRLVFSAYDGDGQLLTQTLLPGANLANSDSTIAPNILLSVSANNIYRVTLCAFDGHFTIDGISFCF
jgi:hypothetical protein